MKHEERLIKIRQILDMKRVIADLQERSTDITNIDFDTYHHMKVYLNRYEQEIDKLMYDLTKLDA